MDSGTRPKVVSHFARVPVPLTRRSVLVADPSPDNADFATARSPYCGRWGQFAFTGTAPERLPPANEGTACTSS